MAAPLASAVSLIQRANCSPLGAASSSTLHAGRRVRRRELLAFSGPSDSSRRVVSGMPGMASPSACHASAALLEPRRPLPPPERDSAMDRRPSTTTRRNGSRNGMAWQAPSNSWVETWLPWNLCRLASITASAPRSDSRAAMRCLTRKLSPYTINAGINFPADCRSGG